MAGFGVLDAMGYIQKQGEMGRERGQENRLAQLSQQAYGATGQDRISALGQMEGVRPGTGLAYGDKMQAQDDGKAKRYGGAARYLLNAIKTNDPAAIQGAYMATRPAWGELANGKPIPDQYDEQMLPMLHQVIAASEGAGGESNGQNIQSTYINAQGQRVGIRRDGSQITLGDANQSIRVLEQEGAVPYGVVTSGGVAGQVVPLGGGQPQQGAPQGQPQPQPQRAQGEVPFSIDPSLPQSVQASIRANEGQWAAVPDGGQVQIPQATQPAPQASYGGGPVRTPTAGEKARDVAQGSISAGMTDAQRAADNVAQQRLALASRTADRADATQARADAIAKVKSPQAMNASALRVYKAGMSGLMDGLSGTETGPLIGRLPALTTGQQKAEGGVAAMAPVLKQLFRSAGEGVFTDKDQEMLIKMLPTRTDTAEARKWKMGNIDRIVEAKLNTSIGGAAPAAVQRATNPQTGEVLELRNGRWVPAQ